MYKSFLSTLTTGVFLLLTLGFVVSAAAEKAKKTNGQVLHDAQCMKCHKTEVYTRKDKKIKSLAALKGRVNQCASNTKSGWNSKQIDEVIEYLNSSFYKFSVFE